MNENVFEKYLLHPVEREITDADAKVELICSKDHPIMDYYYESCFYRHDYTIAETTYALPYSELFCFMSTNNNDEKLDAVIFFNINGTVLTVDRPCMIQVPAYIPRGPIEIKDVKTPVFSFNTGFGREHAGIPEQWWSRELPFPVEEMIINNKSDYPGGYDPHVNPWQHVALKCLPGKTMHGEISTVMRRFDKTDGWVYVNDAHMHGSPELVGYYGTNGWNPYRLDGEYTVYVGGREFRITKPTLTYFPAYVPHCPIIVHNVEKQNFWHSLGRSVGSFGNSEDNFLNNLDVSAGEIIMEEPW